ncbi:hypothetical protein ABIB40_001662 [Pedobacter sp. UYP30]|uniref:LiaF transmembrane domain-containing protein n=1 Tax=Pedobacter sp. UYP30 TaxID=1756400 RepID=UPI00339807B1
MRLNRLIWGILLLFIGGVLLLQNFNVINFYWGNIWRFWPMLLIIFGVNILFNKSNSNTGQIISLVLLVATLSFLFFRGQQPSDYSDNFTKHLNLKNNDDALSFNWDDEGNSDDTLSSANQLSFSEPMVPADSTKETVLNISGGGISFNLDGETTALFDAKVKNKRSNFSLNKMITDSLTVLNFKMLDKNNKFNFGEGGNNVDFRLNKSSIWTVDMKLGAGESDFDFEHFKVRTFTFNGGASALKLKFGALLPIADVVVKSGVADIKIEVPQTVGCRITAKTGLSSKDFNGFDKIGDGVYQTSNYNSSTKKIFIKLDGGLSSFEVDRY